MKRKNILQILFLILLVAGTVFVAIQNNNAPYKHSEGKIFGTYYSIIYQSSDNLQQDIDAALKSVDNSLSMFNEKSTIARLNRGENPIVDDNLRFLFPRAMKVSEATDGAFDITVAPLVNAWGFGFKKEQWPTEAEIDSLKSLVGYKTVHLNDRTITKDNPKTMIDLSAIAKGYGSDAVAKALDKAKVKNYMVEIGGEVVVKGKNDKGKDWKIGVSKPSEDAEKQNAGYQCIISITDCALATSGNYRNFFYKDGVKYAHTIDPRTGHPVQQDIISATVVAPHCYEADAFATSFMVTGLAKAKQILAKQTQLYAYLIYINKEGEQEVWMTEGMKKYLKD